MPVMDGYTLLREWKADDALKGVPFIVCTATSTDPKDEQLALDLGADAVLRKPAEPDAFVQALQRVMDAGPTVPALPTDTAQALESHNATLVRKREQKAAQLESRVAERETGLRALGAGEARFRAVFDHSVDIILLTAPNGTVLAANPAACQAFGMAEAEVCARGRSGVIDTTDPRRESKAALRAPYARVADLQAALAPDVPVLIGSGRVDVALQDAAAAAGVRGLLHKERLVEDLLPMLRVVLAARPAG